MDKQELGPIEFNRRDPVYLQVVRHFKEMIATGVLKAGETIPSRRELGAILNINPNTAQRAYKEMEDQQLIVTEKNTASRITTDELILQSIRAELIALEVESFVAAMRKIDVPLEELIEWIRKEYRRGAGGNADD